MKNNNKLKKIAVAVSLALFVLWSVLGTGASLAWFTDESEIKNIFHFAEFDLDVYHRLENGEWEKVEQDTKLFDDQALYEPGYVQTVYLRVDNKGSVPFVWNTAVRPFSNKEGINVFGDTFDLKEYLQFGVVEADTFEELSDLISTREKAVSYANESLDFYSTTEALLDANGSKYLAIIIRMPEEVTNVANYVPPNQPEIELSVIVSATQQKN